MDVDAEWKCVELLIISIFQCNTSAVFVLPESKLIVIPTDHMDIFVYSKDLTSLGMDRWGGANGI